MVSASSSFLRLILSFKPSASRRAAVILACICSPLISAAILTEQAPGKGDNQLIQVGVIGTREGDGEDREKGGKKGRQRQASE